jgi:hypothetical protein
MKNQSLMLRTFGAIAVLGTLVTAGQAQNREKFGISAKAGGVNAVMGRVMVARVGQAPQLLSNQDDLVAGDVVTTGAASQTEVLLNPGSYLRVAENSEFIMVDNSLNNLLIKLVKGSVIVEATGMDNLDLRIAIATDRERLTIIRPGIYRINAQTGVTELLVRKGRVAIGDNPREIVKGGKKLAFSDGSALTAKLEKRDKDEFDNWSKVRGETLARANQRLSARTLNGYLSAADWTTSTGFGRWGVWTWSPFLGCRTFLPFYFGWTTPYGPYYGLFYSLGDYYPGMGCCRGEIINRQPMIVNNPPSSGGSSGGFPGGFGGSSGGSSGGSGSGGSPSSGTLGPSSPMPSQPRPRDPEVGSGPSRIKTPD